MENIFHSGLDGKGVAMHASNSIIKFADDTTVLGLITNMT